VLEKQSRERALQEDELERERVVQTIRAREELAREREECRLKREAEMKYVRIICRSEKVCARC
jgi:hypothetical protein